MTLTAHWQNSAWIVDIDNDGGTGTARVYADATNGGIYQDATLQLPAISITPPTQTGYDFLGYWDFGDDTQVVDADGEFLIDRATYDPGDDVSWYAKWSAGVYTLTFDGNGGTPGRASQTVAYNAEVTTLPGCTWAGHKFSHWSVNGERLEAGMIWRIAAGATAVAEWEGLWGGVTDWFGLAGANGCLMCVSSDDGGGVNTVETSHTGALDLKANDSAVGAFAGGGKLLNPTCRYRVRKNGNVTVTLGAVALKATSSQSGVMITSIEYTTGADQEPTITVTGTANEGSPAVNTKAVTIAVKPDHIAQAPLGGVSGGGELVACVTRATCEPVVLYDGLMPVSSDTVHHKVQVSATTAAYLGEGAPVPSTGFVSKGVAVAKEDTDFTTYSLTAERSI